MSGRAFMQLAAASRNEWTSHAKCWLPALSAALCFTATTCHASSPSTNLPTTPLHSHTSLPEHCKQPTKGTGQQMSHNHAAVSPSLPMEKLACHLHPHGEHAPCVLVSCGSFNPPTMMHLRMFEAARHTLIQRGLDVLGGYLSPVHDGYGKPGLAAAQHRIHLCEAAVQGSDWIMLDSWEASQEQYQRTLNVLQHVQKELDSAMPVDDTGAGVKVMLLCGSDLLASFARPGVWKTEHLDSIFVDHGVVVVTRPGGHCTEDLLSDKDGVLYKYRDHVVCVRDVVDSTLSSTAIRKAIREGWPLTYLVPDQVVRYLEEHQIYEQP